MWISKSDFDSINDKIVRLENKVNCLTGVHKWILSRDRRGKHIIICEHCYVKLESKE